MPVAPDLRLGGHPAATALHLDGRTVTYGDLGALVADRSAARSAEPADAVLDLTGRPVTEVLVEVFAAAAARRRIRLADPAAPAPAAAGPPNETHGGPGDAADPHWLTVVTSGSSGSPRAVRRSVGSWTASFAALSTLIGFSDADRVLLTGPMHATLHLFAAVHTLAGGGEVTDAPERATIAHAVPAVLGDLVSDPRTSGLRTVVVAGAAVDPDLIDAAAHRGLSTVEYYGAAELSFVSAGVRRPGGSPGLRPFPGVTVDVRDGEIWVRSPYLSSGYPTGVTGPFRQDDAGFATVGDRGVLTADGHLLVRGRGSSAITVGGATVLAEDVEAALVPLVTRARRSVAGRPAHAATVAVVGAPVPRLAAVVVAVIADDDGPLDVAALRAAARRSLTGASLPRRWLAADRLPRTPGGKLARGALQDAVRRYLAGRPPAPGDPRLRPLS